MLKKILLWIIVVMSVIFCGTCLILIVYSIPTSKMYGNLMESKTTLKSESKYHFVIKGEFVSILDNYTDAVMLLTASYSGDELLPQKSMKNYRADLQNGMDPYIQLLEYDDTVSYVPVPYSRYWHGYLVFLKPLLSVFNYSKIRNINMGMQVILLVILCVLMMKKKVGKYILPFLSSYMLICPKSIFNSLQNSTVWYIILISCIVYLVLKDKIIDEKMHYILFTIVGMITSYMDFLTYPIATFGMLIIFVLFTEKLTFKNSIKRIFLMSLFWVLGYGIMWGSKWVIASIITGDDIIKEAIRAIKERSSSIVWRVKVSRIGLIKEILVLFNNIISVYVMLLNSFIITCIFLFKIKRYKYSLFLKSIISSIPIIIISLITPIWYVALANHTCVHAFLSFRTALPLWFAILVVIYKLIFEGATNERV